jgi:hypothetical protein
MKWVTREKARVDRIACPWLISRFIDREPTFLFVPTNQVMTVAEREGAIPYDVPNAVLGHHGEECAFDAFLRKYNLTDPALGALALIVRGADTDARQLTPQSAGCTRWPPASRRTRRTITTTWRSSSRRTMPSTRIAALRSRPADAASGPGGRGARHGARARRVRRPARARRYGRL